MTISEIVTAVRNGQIKQAEPKAGALIIFPHAFTFISILECSRDALIAERNYKGTKTQHKYTARINGKFAILAADVYIVDQKYLNLDSIKPQRPSIEGIVAGRVEKSATWQTSLF